MTNRDVHQFLLASAAYLADEKRAKDSKFAYALKKVQKAARSVWESHLEAREDIDIEKAATDEKTGILLRDASGALSFTKDGMKERTKAIRDLYASPAQVQSFVAAWPDDLNDAEREAFELFVPDAASEKAS